MSEELESGDSSDRFSVVVAVLIAAATILGAIVSWRAALSEDIAGDQDYSGLRSLAWAEEARTLNAIDAYEDYRLFLAYRRSDLLGDLIEEQKPDEDSYLGNRLQETRQLAEINVSFLDETKASRYLKRDGGYALDRELGEKWAQARRKKDMDASPYFEAADRYRSKTESQLKAGFLLTCSLVFLALIETFKGVARYIFLALASAFMLWGSVMALMLEKVS